ncbi:hypothetical protein H257_14599 [Aphanomyces astaci]|uniref:Uncharacterized protein n=1 Tax=Aphanomyces astaci TaxID=112090 RepID=W4FQK0_APHAT|nr:hypothetical protein H257_14599 [Aphanomyces astaci]ETV69762.1 hypothetical protein H257_14599 [Aphanomyces astaci]|eukprot:XP_009840776.1 hypothetical protein H257_14599 [Aphanomyces astaci]
MADKKAAGVVVKCDEVSKNQIWREHLKKELLMEGPSTPFQFNPKTLSSVTPKPTMMKPSDFSRTDPVGSTSNEVAEKVKQNVKKPQEISAVPMTEAQKVGWAHDQAWKNGRGAVSKRWYRGRGSTDVTEFAENYCTMAGCSPFADKSTR